MADVKTMITDMEDDLRDVRCRAELVVLVGEGLCGRDREAGEALQQLGMDLQHTVGRLKEAWTAAFKATHAKN